MKTSIEILQEYSLWAKEENEEPYMGAKDLHNIVYDEWRANGRQVSWTPKEFSSLNRQEFWDLVFPNSLEHYFEPKWSLFQEDKLSFLWSCSVDKIKILVDYIHDCKRG